MIVHRFMSADEYNKLMAGEVLTNNDRHEGWLTTSIGFCFFVEPPDEAIHWLGGVTFPDYCVTMEINAMHLRPSMGHYRNPAGGTMNKVEYCTTSYSLQTVTVLHVTDEWRERADMRRALIALGILK